MRTPAVFASLRGKGGLAASSSFTGPHWSTLVHGGPHRSMAVHIGPRRGETLHSTLRSESLGTDSVVVSHDPLTESVGGPWEEWVLDIYSFVFLVLFCFVVWLFLSPNGCQL